MAALLAFASTTVCTAQMPAAPPPHSPREGWVQSFTADTESGAWLGVRLEDVTAARVQSMKLPGDYGAIIVNVDPDSPAAKAGLKENDVILEFGGMKVWSAAQLAQLVRETPPGRAVELTVSRAGKKLNLKATLAAGRGRMFAHGFTMPQFHFNPRNFNFRFAPFGHALGIRGETLTSQLASYFGVKEGKGVLVANVDKDSPASKAGLEAGDCIIKVGSTPISSVFDLTRALAKAKGSQVTLSIVRARQEKTLTATLEPGSRPHGPAEGQAFGPELNMQLREIQRELPNTKEIQKEIEKQVPLIQEQAQELERSARQLEQRVQHLQHTTSAGEV